jgi:tRNA(Met) cytidine acetyltransferase
LTLAHYRSTPDDFRLLLDAPNMSLLLARRGDQLAGAVLVAREGSLQADLAANIRAGRRRPRGHLLPQTLYAQTGSDQLLARQCWRVVRIAVHPALQRRGLGLRMLEQLQQSASAARIDCLGSSFGATRELLAFWRRAHYVPVAIGVRRDASSGAHALLILQGLNAPMIALMESERARFAELMPAMLADPLQQLEPAVVAAVLAALAEPHYRLTPRDRADVRAFVSAARGYDYCQLALWKATLILLSDQRLRLQLDALQRGVLIARVLQKHSWAEVARRYGLTGRAQVLHCLRSAFDDAVGATP